jgi:hypothetical protein
MGVPSMPRLNWDIIGPNIADAREELQRIEACIQSGKRMSEVEFQILMQHIYHHLNFAWNARHWTTKRYAQLTGKDFKVGGRLPEDLEFTENV